MPPGAGERRQARERPVGDGRAGVMLAAHAEAKQ